MTTIEDAAGELYGVLPADFAAARNARAASTRRDGDRDLAAGIAALPKPSAGAGAINAVVRDDEADAARIADLGERFRSAESRLDRPALVELTRERKTLIADLVGRARQLAADAGHPLNASAVEELEQTLRAGVADENAGVAILTGRLVMGLRADGIDAVDVESAVAGSARAAKTRSRSSSTSRPDRQADRDAERARAEAQRAADREAALARKAWKTAEARRAKLAARVSQLEGSRAELDAERDRLAAELRSVESRRDEVAGELEQQGSDLEAAEADERAAHDAAEAAGGLERGGL